MKWFSRNSVPIPRVEVLNLRPGDILVIETPHRMSQDVAEQMRHELAKVTGHDERRVMVVMNATLRIVREGEPPPPLVFLPPATEMRGI